MQTSSNRLQILVSLFRTNATLRTILLPALLLSAILSAPSPQANADQTALPNLQGAAATAQLKQQGRYNSLDEFGARASGLKVAPPPDQSIAGTIPSTYGAIWTPRESNRNWYSVASSADGNKLVAVVKGGQIYTSTDSGVSWTPRDTNRNWHTVTSSADGTKLAAVVNGGQVYTSTNSGVSWTARESDRPWFAIASSADGSKLAATVVGDHILTSTNSGLTWTTRDDNRNWRSVASSSDGNKLIALDSNNLIYTSTDSGVSWTPRESNRNWYATASSADGSKLVATVGGGRIYTSTDSGVSWTPRESNRIWESVASSADGSKLVAVVIGGQIYTSTDSGVNWTPRESNRNWESVASSADGSKLVAVVNGGQIYTSNANSTPTITPLGQTSTAGSPTANVQVATVNDADEAANILQIQISSDGTNFSNTATLNGVTVSLTDSNAEATGTNPNATGQVFADVVAACDASNSNFTLKVTDSLGATGTATLMVTVSANTPPTLSYNNPAAIVAGYRTTVNPVTGPSDNGKISSITVQNTGTFTGTIDVNSAGMVSVFFAAPVGTHSITIRATDNCGVTTDATFTLTVNCINSLTVNNNGDEGDAIPGDGVCETVTGNGICTLRAAIQEFNHIICAPLTINFNIPGAGPHTITPITAFPEIHKSVVIDGTTQAGASCTAGGLKIELNGVHTQGQVTSSGLQLLPGATGSLIKGLVISRFGGYGIVLSGQFSNNQTVQCNYIGTDVTGTIERGNKNGGIRVDGEDHLIGGTTLGTGNLISGNVGSGIKINGTGIQVKGNYIGVNASGTGAITNIGAGVEIQQLSSNILIGGEVPGARNIISGNVLGIQAVAATNVVIKGNYIGTDVTGTQAIGNHSGITLVNGPIETRNCIIGGIGAGEANIIAFSMNFGGNHHGVAIEGINNIVRGNSIFSNPGLGIDLPPLGVLTDNDWRDLNGRQNFPIITAANAEATIVSGTLNSGPNMAFIIDVYSNTTCDSSGYGEGKTYLGSTTTALTDNNGDVSFNVTVPPLQAGQFITATATATDGRFNTSEFSPCKATNSPPTISPSSSLARQQGSATTNSQIATVSDSSAGTLTTIATTVPAGLSVTNIVNNGGSITADVAALCNATVGENTVVLTVTNGATGLTNTANLTVNVTANTAPTLGAYPNSNVTAGGNTIVTPYAVPSDNGSVMSITAAAGFNQSPFTGTFVASPTSGVVTITDAKPAGTYTVTVTAMDNCGAITTRSFTLTVNNPSACTNPSFTGTTEVVAGSSPTSVAVGDFNGDGKQDLAVANQNPGGQGTVSIRLGDGLGSFSGTTTVNVGAMANSQPFFVAVGDFNGDGKQDLAVANYNANTVSIRLGDGVGNFSGTTEVNVLQLPQTIAIGDFNGDGKQDFAVGCYEFGIGSNVPILLGDGAGNFSNAPGFSAGTGPISVAIGDFNGDGKQDLAVANYGNGSDNTVSIRLGDGAGNFSGITNISVGSSPAAVAVGDFNGDGKQDLAVANQSSNTVSIRLGNGAGNFSGTTNVSVGITPSSVAVGDFNGDGKLDFATANYGNGGGGNTVSIRLGDGVGNFSSTTDVSVGNSPTSVVVGDFNGDGKQDLATPNLSGNTVSIRLNNCTFNTVPSFATIATPSRQQGSAASNSTIATVTDAETAAGSLTVTITSANPSNGVTISNIQNINGTITADIIANCTASNASFTLQVSDDTSTATATLSIVVTANTPPTLSYNNPPALIFGNGATVNPATGPSDNDSVNSIVLQSQGTFTGTVMVNNITGVVTLSNAAPIGTHTITIATTDNCNQTMAASFTLTVNNTPPTITAGAIAARQQGSAGVIHAIASVNDTETPRANLSVTVMSAPAGINVTDISAPNALTGEVTALVEAACTAATGANVVVLKVTDGNGGTATANLTVNVTANTAPSLSYNNPSVSFGGGVTITPATATDNGSIASFALQSQGTYTGAINVNSATGAVALGNAQLVGQHTITIRAMDNCNLTKDASFTLTVAQAGSVTSITADNPDSSAVGQNVTVAFSVAAAPPGTGTPTGTVTVSDGVASCTGALSNGGGSCVLALTTAGNRTLTASYAGDANFSGISATESHTVVAPPLIAKSFSPNAVLLNQTTTLTITITNPAANTVALTGVGLTDNFPPGLEVDATPMIGNSCSTGVFAPAAGATNLNLSNATIPAGAACTFSVKVKATTPGLKTNTTGAVSSDNGGNGLAASAQLQVNGPPVIAAIPLTLAAGSAAKPFDIATINDAEDGPLPLVFRLSADGNSFGTNASQNGVTVNFVSVGADGKVKAEVSTSCTATTATFTFKATDRDNQVTTVSWTVTVAANTPPALSYAGVSVKAGTTPSFTPAGGPADNGAITGINLQSITPATGLALSVNNSTGLVTVTNASISGAYTVVIRATDDCGLMTDATFTMQVGCPAISLGPATLPAAAVNTAYSHSLTASPAGTNYNFAVTSGALPAGLTLNANGSFSGAPTNSGVFNFRVTVSGWGGGCTAFRDYVLVVDCPTVTVNPANLPGGTVGTNYNQTISASPSGSYGYSVTSGALPPGLTLNAATGAIAGTPAQAGSFAFTVTAAVGGCSGARGFTLVIGCPAITLASLNNATAGVSYAGSVAASPSGDYSYSLQSGGLPAGMTLNPTTGALTGLATVTGTFSFTVKAQAANGCGGSQSYSLAVVCPAVTLSALNAPQLNVAYSQTLTALPAGGNYGFAVASGVLPAGLSLNPASGLLSGTPNLAGTYNFTIAATGFGGCAGSREYSFVIGGAGCPAISLPGSLPAGSVGQLYSQAVTASPVGTYSYTVTAGSLPPGVTLFGNQGLLFGYPTAPGNYSFTIRATDANNCAASQNYAVGIGLGMLPESLPQATVGQAYRQTLTAPGARGEARFAVVAGALPSEMNLSRDGVLTGTPQQPGMHAFTVQASDSAGFIGKRDYTLVLPPIFPPPSDPLAMTAAIDGCAVGGGTASVTMTVRNFGVVSAPVNFEAPLPAEARALPDSCAANLGACAATPQQVAWNGNLSPNQTVTITFRIQFDDNLSTQTCLTASAKVVNIFGAPATASACAVNCTVVGPGTRLAAVSPISDVKAGSVLIYNIYTSATDPTRQNTRLSITNTDPARQAFVHLFFVDGASCSVADSFLCLTPNQTTSFLASDLDPGTTGYVVAVATDATGCPTNFNFLIGDEYVKFQSGHAANLGAQAITAIAGGLPVCDTKSSTATLNFDGVSYAPVPRVLALDSIPSRADGNDTMLILNRIGGNLGTGVATLGTIFGILYDDAEVSLSFTLTGGCQLRGCITNNFPRTAPRFEQFIPAGRTGWMKLYSQSDDSAIGLTGAAINFNANATASAGAFNQGHNLHALTNTSAMNYVLPVFPPGC